MLESDAPHWNSILPPVGLPETVSIGHAVAPEVSDLVLTAGEKNSLGVRVAETRKTDFKMGRLAARRALSELGMESVGVERAEGGAPVWPPGVVGSITHTAQTGLSLVAFATEIKALGVDMEQRRPVEEIERLVAFGPETDWVRPEGVLDEDRLLSLFAAKEAVFKAFYPAIGKFFGFEAARLDWNDSTERFRGILVDPDLLPGQGEFEVSVSWFGDFVLAWTAVLNDRNG